jgi:hypothetical protein
MWNSGVDGIETLPWLVYGLWNYELIFACFSTMGSNHYYPKFMSKFKASCSGVDISLM